MKAGHTAVLEVSAAESGTTNNRMEMRGVLLALQSLKRPVKATVISDSQYVIKGMSEWIFKWLRQNPTLAGMKNADLWLELLKASEPHDITWQWVRGHSGVQWNERADKLATEAVKQLKASGYAQWHMEGRRYVIKK
jgi:ribonuclease HI